MAGTLVETVLRTGGRQVAVHRLADGDSGRTLVLCHPAPGAGTLDPCPEETWGRGVTLLAPDRPGYGRSDPLHATEWATVGAAADDLAAVLDQAGIGPAGLAGWGAGGWVALALAASRPDLVDRLVLLGTPAPSEHVPWLPSEQQEALAALQGIAPETALAALRQWLSRLLPADPQAPTALSVLAASPADEVALRAPGARERLARMLEAAFVQGTHGWASDLAGYSLQPWGFEMRAVQAKTLLLYGSRDPVAGPRHGTWWQKRLPDARLEVCPGAGHLLILRLWPRALSHLAPRVKRQH